MCCWRADRPLLHLYQLLSHSTGARLHPSKFRVTGAITSKAKLDIALEAVADCPMVQLVLVVGASSDDLPNGGQFASYEDAIASHPSHAIEDEVLGTSMPYSSTTGRPKGIIRPLTPQAPAEPLPLYSFRQLMAVPRRGGLSVASTAVPLCTLAAVNLTLVWAAPSSSWNALMWSSTSR